MTTFPVITSTLSPEHLSSFVKEKYDLGDNTICRLFRTGINHTYMISDIESRWVLRVYSFNWRSEVEINEELKLLNLLKENNISISYPIRNRRGNYIQKINAPEGVRYIVLFSYAKGEKIRYMTENICSNIGLLMAEFHNKTLNQNCNRTEYNAETLARLPYQYANKYYSASLKEMEFVQNAGKYLTFLFSKQDLNNIRTGIVHLDIWYDNMNILNGKEITLFDFDFCGKGWFVFDIAYFCMQLFHIETDKKQYDAKVKSFLEGYEKMTIISEDERKLIPFAGLAVWIFYLGVQSQRFDWSNIFLTENYLKMYIGKVKNWLEYHNIEIPIVDHD